MAASRRSALAIASHPLAQSDGPASEHGRFGGAPLLPRDFDWPKDRAGVPMLFIAQFDLGRLPPVDVKWPNHGLLSIFRAAEILTMPVKERRSFHISYLPQFDYSQLQPLQSGENNGPSQLPSWAVQATPSWTVSEEPDSLRSQLTTNCSVTMEELSAWAQKYNRLCCGDNLFFGADLIGLAEHKEVCAFAASGITHSPARAGDRHYSHLIDDAANWMLLAKFDDTQLFSGQMPPANPEQEQPGQALPEHNLKVAETRILIKSQDLELGLFERAWIICLKTALIFTAAIILSATNNSAWSQDYSSFVQPAKALSLTEQVTELELTVFAQKFEDDTLIKRVANLTHELLPSQQQAMASLPLTDQIARLWEALRSSSKNNAAASQPVQRQMSDSSPHSDINLNRRIMAFTSQHFGQQVGDGECWSLAAEALKACGALPAQGYTFGREIDRGEEWWPGDIVQFTSCKFKENLGGGRYRIIEAGSPNHTAIFGGKQNGMSMIAQANYNGKKTVAVMYIDFDSLVKGKYSVYRPLMP